MKWRLLIMLVCGLHSAKAQDVAGLYEWRAYGYASIDLKPNGECIFTTQAGCGLGGGPAHAWGTWKQTGDTVFINGKHYMPDRLLFIAFDDTANSFGGKVQKGGLYELYDLPKDSLVALRINETQALRYGQYKAVKNIILTGA